MKEILGQFTVIDKDVMHHRVIVGQEKEIDENQLITGSRKFYSLNDLEGEEIELTDSPNVFLRGDGSLLKRIGSIRLRG